MVKLPEKKIMKLPVLYDKTHYNMRRLVREEYARRQLGFCCHCGKLLTKRSGVTKMKVDKSNYPPQFFEHKVHLHHSHNSGLTIGAVHAHCNAVLMEYFGE